MIIKDLENRKVGIWGLGIEGKAVLKVLNKTFPDKEIFIIDDKNYTNSQCLVDDLKNLDVIIRSPSVSIYRQEVLEAKKNGVIFITEKTLFFNEINCNGSNKPKTIAITGTKGKTTTSTFCAYLLKNLGYKTLLIGNMGIPSIELIDEAKKSDFVVAELSSYQVSDLSANIDFGVVLNLFPEHIDWHKTHENYYKDKMNLIKNVSCPIVNGSDDRIHSFIKDIKDIVVFNTNDSFHYKNDYFCDGDKKLFSTKNMKLLGEHNYQNLCSVLAILKLLNINFLDVKQEYFDNFEPIEHRLELINKGNIIFVNDSISTTPETAIACYNVFKDKNIYGILGGFDRDQDYSILAKYIKNNENIKFLALLGQTSSRISDELKNNNFYNYKVCDSLEECVYTLYDKAKKNNNSVIILSPASPSYDMFKNFEMRGNCFKNYISKLL